MSLYLDKTYITNISNRVRNFKRKGEYQFSLSCPFCGDSKKNPRAARGNFYLSKGRMKYNCYNDSACAKSSVSSFLYDFDRVLYNQYRLDSLTENKTEEKWFKEEKIISHKIDPLSVITKFNDLPIGHYCREYVESRLIPTEYKNTLYFTDKFCHWTNEYVEHNKFSEQALQYDKPRLVIPLINKDGTMHGLQGRTFDPKDTAKYITIITDERYPKIYGLDRVNFNKTIYVLEGIFDSIFISNAIAMCGGNLTTCLKNFDKNKIVLIFDNEPRNKQTVKKMKSAIDSGYKIVIMPDDVSEKDINKMIQNGYSSENIMKIIETNTYSGMSAILRWSQWRR